MRKLDLKSIIIIILLAVCVFFYLRQDNDNSKALEAKNKVLSDSVKMALGAFNSAMSRSDSLAFVLDNLESETKIIYVNEKVNNNRIDELPSDTAVLHVLRPDRDWETAVSEGSSSILLL